MRIDAALAAARAELEGRSDSARLDAEILLARALGVAKPHLIAHPDAVLDAAARERFFAAVARRRQGVPLAYITGEKEFWSLRLAVGPDVLVPRPETELLVELALRHVPAGATQRILDLGTGSGAIALAIASERPACHLTAVDLSRAALAIARQNARTLGLANVTFLRGDWTVPVAGQRFDLIVSNPPYVRPDDPALAALKYEPSVALTSGGDGLEAIRTIAGDSRALLEPAGLLMLEHGNEQKGDVADILRRRGWGNIDCFDDLAGRPRVTIAANGPLST